jgi:hypothetical protein
MIPFKYREFYDIPRTIFFTHGDKSYLFNSEFVDAKDEYSKYYTVYLVPNLNDNELSGSWASLFDSAISKVGSISTDDVIFDETKRKSLNSDILNKITQLSDNPQIN